MLMHIIIFLIGLTALHFGSKWVVKGSSRLASILHIQPIIIGVTIVAFGGSAPEGAVSIVASFKGNSDIVLGNILGSVIANIGLVLGISAMISPLKVRLSIIKKELPLMIGAIIVFYLMALDLRISRLEGGVLLTGFILFLIYVFYQALRHRRNSLLAEKEYGRFLKGERRGKSRFLLFVFLGLISIIGGAHLLIKSAIFIAEEFEISQLVIAITLVAIGTSLPELAVSTVAAYRKEADISVGNVIGSNIFNISFIIGAAAMINPLSIEKGTRLFEFPVSLVFGFLLFLIMKTRLEISRIEGAFLLTLYVLFLISLCFFR